MAEYCHASHEVYHEGVAQRAHNLSPVPFGAAKRAKESSYHCSDTGRFAEQASDGSQACSARSPPRRGAATHHACPAWYPFRAPTSRRSGAGGQEFD